jgi:alkaline phosphatase D
MKIAFASCFDALQAPQQPVWERIRKTGPEVLLLLGDSIYMDYFPHLYQSKKWPLQRFADEMHRRYAAQWQVPGFRDLLTRVQHVGAVWDDHDFAWNQSHGAGAVDKPFVEIDKRRIARALFDQYRDALRHPHAAYPQQPALGLLLQAPTDGNQTSFDVSGVRFILLDGRTHRTEARPDGTGTLHGAAQLAWWQGLVSSAPGVCIVASGSTLARSKESWDNYLDYEWLMERRWPRVLLLSGDVHGNKARRHKLGDYTLHEATSSGVARPGLGGEHGNFGLVTLAGTRAVVQWFSEDEGEEPEMEKIWDL